MKPRMALVAVKGNFEGPWQRTSGREGGILVENLGEGEVILLDYSIERQLQLPIAIESNGRFPFPKCDSFRFVKQQANGKSETFVQVLID